MPAQLARDQVSIEQTWNLDDIYATPADWEADYHRVEAEVAPLAAFQGRLGQGGATLLAFLRQRDAVLERYQRLGAYARFGAATDGTDARFQALSSRAGALGARLAAALSFVPTELLALPEGLVERYLADEPDLTPYRAQIDDVLALRGHVLAPETERALAALGELFDSPRTVWQRVTAGDIACPPIVDEHGVETAVTIGRWQFGFAQSPNRDVRRRAYDALTVGLDRHKHTVATTLATHIQTNVTLARLRGYASAAEMILAPQRVPHAVYKNVLAVVHDGMAPHMRRLVRLRQRVLGLDRVYHYDLRAPLDPEYDPPTTFQEAEPLIAGGLRVLGDEYAEIVRAAFRDRWVDWADNVGKRGGGFCGTVYGVHPYVFMNWRDNLRTAFVLAHELGHAGHGVLRAGQIISNAGNPDVSAITGAPYPRFFVEAPSTVNELLLGRHMLESTDDPRLRRFVVEQFLGTFTHNMVTHMLEAHFEQRLYDLAEADQPITTRTVLDTQAAVFERFFGDAVALDEGARLYWAQQPHFYVDLYPYTYAAGVACALGVADAIRAEGQPAVDRWLDTLRLGSSLPPLDLARHAGVDMTSPEPLRRAVAFFGALVDDLETSFPA